MAEEFKVPEFLQDCDVDTLHEQMMNELPNDIDKIQGGFPWDFTRPSATLSAQLLQFYIPETLKLMFVQWAWGIFLDYHARAALITRKAASHATTTLKVTGVTNTFISAGTVFCTEATDDTASINFLADEDVIIGNSGIARVPVTAEEAGSGSNVNVGTIVLLADPINTISNITNESAVTDGEDEETDDALRARILEHYAKLELSFTGNDADYKRWSEEVDGVGHATIIPYNDGSGRVRIILLDSSGDPASEALCTAVYNHIMRPDDHLARLAPPDAIPIVSPPEIVSLAYSAEIELKEGAVLVEVQAAFEEALDTFYTSAIDDGEVKYTAVHALLQGIPGVNDFRNLTVNSGVTNISIPNTTHPVTVSVTFTEVTI